MIRKLIVAAAVAASLFVGASVVPAAAQNYPTKPIRLVVPYAPGGPTDLTARIVAQYLSEHLGQNVIVENRPGAGTAIGISYVAKAAPDGYTLLWASSDGLSILPAVKPSVPYKVGTDFTFVATLAKYSGPLLAINAKLPVHSVAELIAYGRAHPGKLRYSSTGVGSGVHLSTAFIGKQAGIDMVHVPYEGAAPAILAASAGFVDMILVGQASLKPFTDNGTLRAIAAASDKRNATYPDVPTLEESGLQNVNVDLYLGLLGPAGVPADIVARLGKEIGEMARQSEVMRRFTVIGAEPAYLNSADFKAYFLKDYNRWHDIAVATGISIQ